MFNQKTAINFKNMIFNYKTMIWKQEDNMFYKWLKNYFNGKFKILFNNAKFNNSIFKIKKLTIKIKLVIYRNFKNE
jgi:hypothetical protein